MQQRDEKIASGFVIIIFTLCIVSVSVQKESKEESPEKHAEGWKTLEGVDGVVLPGGFGTRGVEGKILTAK